MRHRCGGHPHLALTCWSPPRRSDAKKVTVEDGEWPASFAVSGDLSSTFETIPAGATVRLSYQVTAPAAGTHQQRPAVVRYQPDADAPSLVQTTSSSWLIVRVNTRLGQLRARAVRVGAALTGGVLTTEAAWVRTAGFTAAAVAAVVLYGVFRNLRDAGRESRRNAALSSLGIKDSK